MINEMAKTIIKKCTEFIFTNQPNERSDLAKTDLAEELKIDVKTVDRHLKTFGRKRLSNPTDSS